MIDDFLSIELTSETLLQLFPELIDMVNCEQNHPGHCCDVFTHTLRVVEQVPMDLELKLAAILHDIGKPCTRVQGKDGFDHFWGHEQVGVQIAEIILKRLNIKDTQIDTILKLILLHDTRIAETLDEMVNSINEHGREFIRKLLTLQQADLKSHSESYCLRKLPKLEEIRRLYIQAMDK